MSASEERSAAKRQEFTRIVPTEAEIVSLRAEVERLTAAMERASWYLTPHPRRMRDMRAALQVLREALGDERV